jgi:hypothetical protein
MSFSGQLKEAIQKPLRVFPNVEDGTDVRVFDLGSRGFSVTLFDVDSRNTVQSMKIFKSLDQAVRYAEKIAGRAHEAKVGRTVRDNSGRG